MSRFFITCIIALSCLCPALGQKAVETVYLKNGSQVKGCVSENTDNQRIDVRSSGGSVFVFDFDEVASITQECKGVTQTVYLKNGSIIKGCLVERVPGKTVSVQTQDGNLFKYDVEEISSIKDDYGEKVQKPFEQSRSSSLKSYKGYRGFIDLFGHTDFFNGIYGGEIATIHGYQGCPYLFIGGGIGHVVDYYEYEYYQNINTGERYGSELLYIRVPIYLDVRVDIPFRFGGPFFDLRMGIDAFCGDVIGFDDIYGCYNIYTCLTTGYRVQFEGKGGVNFYLGARFCEPSSFSHASSIKESQLDVTKVSLRFGIGFDF